jgi:hypothetical protein
MREASCFWALFVVAMGVLLESCAVGRADLRRGEAGPIVWEVTDIRQTVEDRGNRLRWNYTLVLKNIGSTAVTFDQMTLVTMTPSGNVSGGHSTRPFSQRLEPGAEVREVNNSYSHGCVQNCDPGWVQQMLRAGVSRNIQLQGSDASGRPVTPMIHLRLDSSVGMRQRAVREIGMIAGKWTGVIYRVSVGPAAVTIEPDGRYAWVAPRESGSGTSRTSGDGRVLFESSARRRGALTLYEGEGRRVLAIAYEGLDWEGVLTPAE